MLTAVSPNSFIMTAIRYPCRSVKIRLQMPPPGQPAHLLHTIKQARTWVITARTGQASISQHQGNRR